MRGTILMLLVILPIQISFAQFETNTSQSIEKDLASFDIGLLGTWIHYERYLSEKSTINASLGMEGILYGSSEEFNFAFTPTISVSPRFYYNFKSRAARGKKTINNSANFIAVEGTYIPGIFTISNDETEYESELLLFPNWGLRRTIGKKVILDLVSGYVIPVGHSPDNGQFALTFRFGYVFL